MNTLRAKHAVSLVLSLVGAGLALLGTETSPVLLWIGFGLMFVSVIIGLTVRCPNCGRNLVRRRLTLPKFCPECGHSVNGNEIEE